MSIMFRWWSVKPSTFRWQHTHHFYSLPRYSFTILKRFLTTARVFHSDSIRHHSQTMDRSSRITQRNDDKKEILSDCNLSSDQNQKDFSLRLLNAIHRASRWVTIDDGCPWSRFCKQNHVGLEVKVIFNASWGSAILSLFVVNFNLRLLFQHSITHLGLALVRSHHSRIDR